MSYAFVRNNNIRKFWMMIRNKHTPWIELRVNTVFFGNNDICKFLDKDEEKNWSKDLDTN